MGRRTLRSKSLYSEVYGEPYGVVGSKLNSLNFMEKEVIQKILQKHVNLRDKLFCRGYVITNSIISEKDYPSYGLWIKRTIMV